MKPIALMLVLTLPCLSWAQITTSPAYPQAEQASDVPVAVMLLPREVPAAIVEAAPVPIYQRWFFWTGIAVASALIISGVVFAMTRKPAPLEQKQICGPNGCDACVGFSCP